MKIMKIFRSLAAAAVLVSCFAIHAHGAFNDNTINGDLNSDMTVDIDDVKILSDFLINNECTFSGNADINNDGNVNIFDLIKLKRMLISSDGYTGFIKADGNLLVDETGKQYMIKGMAFGNNVWSNPSYPPENLHHTEESYKELADMGFNSVRFYINYGLFESDSNPYTYNEKGFEWLDKNISQAKKYGIRLLFNMHYPQGGYQSQGNGEALWTNEENQKRHIALWTEIARRYSNEPSVLGYGIVNEPVVPIVTTAEDCLTQWQKLAQQITDGIRSEDENHLIFVERLCAAKDTETGQSQWANFNDENNYVRVNGDNIVYEFHYYEPHIYTHQGFDWAGTGGYDYSYPDENLAMSYDSKWENATFNGDSADLSDGEWQYLESSFMNINNDNYKILSLVFQAQNLGKNGVAYADNLKIDEYDENGQFIKTVYYDDFNKSNLFYFWSNNSSGNGYLSTSIGYDDNTSICIYGTTDDANFGKSNISAVQGHKYKASGYFKVVNAEKDAVVRPRVDVWSSDSAYVLDKNYIETSLINNIQFSIDNNVPVYCGEFGAGINCFSENRGGEQWVSDVIDICFQYGINFNYHTYHENSFGLYTNSPLSPPDQRNDSLYNTLISTLTDSTD